MNKTLEEIKKEFEEKFIDTSSQLYVATGNCINQESGYIIWNFIESTISQTKQELIGEIKKQAEYIKLKHPHGDGWGAYGFLMEFLEKLSNK